jgi:hypothetical protein
MKRLIPIAFFTLVGCGLFGAGSVFPADLQKIEDCVAVQVLTDGVVDPAAIVATCGSDVFQAIADAIQILLDGNKVPAAQAATLRGNLETFKAAHGLR